MAETTLGAVLAGLPAEYVLLDPNGSPPARRPRPLGKGGSGEVYRALFRGRLHRAIKIMRPVERFEKNLGVERFREGFVNEVAALSGLSNEHIARITDFGHVENGSDQVPFVVTEYVDGMPLLEYCALPETDARSVLLVLRQTLTALAYMHAHHFMHCDIKPANILVRPSDQVANQEPSVVVVDLGVSHKMFDATEPSEGDGYTYFFSTRRYVHARLMSVLGNESKNRILRSDLYQYFPWQDLHSFGVTLGDLLEDDAVAEKLRDHIGPRNVEALAVVRERLRNPRPESAQLTSALEVRTAIERIPFYGVAPLGLPELAPVPERGIGLPTGRNRIAGSARVYDLVSHPLFQRLHNLPQLDLLHHVFPGATHTRFVHALHTYELARSAVNHQLASWEFRLDVDPVDIHCLLARSLLDSVSRFHFQHMFEDFFQDRKLPGIASAGLLKGSELLDALLGAPGCVDGYDELSRTPDGHGATLSEIVNDYIKLEWSEVRRRQENPASPVQGFLAGLLSNPVDVDKMAYLIDDSGSSGLPFGRAVAPDPIFEALRVPSRADWAQLHKPVATAVREKALSYIEQAVLSRYWNIQAGYWHRTNRSLQAMVKFLIGSLLSVGRLTFRDFVTETLHLSADGALRWLDREFHDAIGDGALDPRTVDPVAGLLVSQRAIYRRLVTVSPKSTLESRSPDRFIYDALRRRSVLDDHEVCRDAAQLLDKLEPGLDVRPGEVLLDLPRFRREELGGKLLVYSDNPGASLLGEVSTISPLLKGLELQFDQYAKRMRIFVHPRIAEAIAGREERVHGEMLAMLRHEFVESS